MYDTRYNWREKTALIGGIPNFGLGGMRAGELGPADNLGQRNKGQ
jgi:hypothetical protein